MIPFWILGVFVIMASLPIGQWNIIAGIVSLVGGAIIIMLYVTVAPKYPVKAQIFVKRHGNMRILWDQASRLETDKGTGTFKYKFKKLKDETKAALYDNLYPSGRGEIAMFYSPAPGEYYQCNIKEKLNKKEIQYKDREGKEKTVTIEEAEIQAIPDRLLDWMILKQQRMKQKYMQVSAWDRYYPIVVVIVIMVIGIVLFSSMLNSMKPLIELADSAAKTNKEATQIMAAALEKLAEAEGEGSGTQKVTQGPAPPPDLG